MLSMDDRASLRAAAGDVRARGGSITEFVAAYAETQGLTARRVWQVLADDSGDRARTRYAIDDVALDALYRFRGDRVRAHAALAAEGDMPVSLNWFQKCVVRDVWPQELAFMQRGAVARRAASSCLRWEASGPNAIWATDHVRLKVVVRKRHGGKLVFFYLTYFIDCWSRRVMGWVLDVEQTADVVLEALHRSIREVDALDAGGVPDTVMFDNGPSFLSEAVREAAISLDFEGVPVEPYHPNQNGKVERCHQTLLRLALGELAGWRDGPRDLAGRLYDNDVVIDEDVVRSQVALAVHEYNFERGHSAIGGRTPDAKWRTRGRIRRVAGDRLRFLLRRRDLGTVQPSGVWKHNGYYRGPHDEHEPYIGKDVLVASIADDPSFVDIYSTRGEWICTAIPNRDHRPADRRAHRAAQRAQFEQQQERLDRSREMAAQKFGATTADPLEELAELEQGVEQANAQLEALLLRGQRVNEVGQS